MARLHNLTATTHFISSFISFSCILFIFFNTATIPIEMGRSDASIARRAAKRGRTFDEQAKIDLHPEHFAKRERKKRRFESNGVEKKKRNKPGDRKGRFKVAQGDWFCPRCGNHKLSDHSCPQAEGRRETATSSHAAPPNSHTEDVMGASAEGGECGRGRGWGRRERQRV